MVEKTLVDILSRESYTRTEYHLSELADTDNDGQLDLVITCSPGDFADRSAGQHKLVYKITDQGFVSEGEPASTSPTP